MGDLLERAFGGSALKLVMQALSSRKTPPEELSQIAVGTLIGYFRSHPEPGERVAQAKRVIAEHRLDATRAQTPLPSWRE